jgi:hypothetical protein
MVTLISSILPIIIKLLGVYFESKEANKEQRQAFLEFVKAIQPQSGESAKGRQSYDEQVKRLQEQINKENGQ